MVSGYAQKFKMAEASDNSCSSEDDEYSDPLEEAASAGARLSVPEKASISRKRKVPLKEHGFIVHTTNIRLCQRNFISLISILAKFVLFEYNHVVGLRETQSYNIDESV